MELYQSLVSVNPITLIAQICNLFIQLFVFKKFFWNKIVAVIDARREAADREIQDAETAKAEAQMIRQTYEEKLQEAKNQADKLLLDAQKSATARIYTSRERRCRALHATYSGRSRAILL